MSDSNAPTVTLERQGSVLLIGLNRPASQNRVDPPTYLLLSKAYYEYENDPSLRAAVLFGHGDHFCAGLDVGAFAASIKSGAATVPVGSTINPVQTNRPRLTKPLVSVVHGNTFFLGHELMLATDIRVAAKNTVFSQGETARALFAGGGATVRFVREAGWGEAMRYMLTGDTWGAEQAQRMSIVQEIEPTPDAALERGIAIANKIAACAPLGNQQTLMSAHQALEEGEDKAFAALPPRFSELMKTHDFEERVKALKENRTPVYEGR